MHRLLVDNRKSALSATFLNIGTISAINLLIILTDPDSIVFINCRPKIDQTSVFEVNILSNSCGI